MLTPERARFHALLLEAGERTLLDRELADALEKENPLSDLALSLTLCRDDGETLHVLHEYVLDHPANEVQVERLLLSEMRRRAASGEESLTTLLRRLERQCSVPEELRLRILAVEEYRDMADEGVVSQAYYHACLDALLNELPFPDWLPENQQTERKRRPNMLNQLKRKFIGDKAFYRAVLMLLIPLVVQQGITSFVNLLDNLMVGSLPTESFSAVAIVNQILMVFNLAVFGGLSGASIFGTQFFGKGDVDGMRQTFRFKLYFCAAVCVIGVGLLWGFDEAFIGLFLQGSSDSGDLTLALNEGLDYLHIMLWGLVPFAVAQTYVSSIRETGETVAPMIASVCAILTNLVLNFLFIYPTRELTVFGFTFTMWGLGEGVRGAALATTISRYVEMAYIMVYSHKNANKYDFMRGAFRNGYVPLHLIRKIAITGSPLLANEILWSLGMTFINQSYSTRGLEAVAATNITGTAWNLFCIIMFAMGNAIAIMVGQYLGRGDKQGARDIDNKLLFLNVVIHVIMGVLLAAVSGLIPMLYNVSDHVRETTQQLLIVAGAALPIHAFLHATYFTIRSGGKTLITFLFDSVYTWLVPVVLAYCLSHFTDVNIVGIYFAVQFIDVVKLIIGLFMLKSDFWANNVVDEVK